MRTHLPIPRILWCLSLCASVAFAGCGGGAIATDDAGGDGGAVLDSRVPDTGAHDAGSDAGHCAASEMACGDAGCVDVQNDPMHCGNCSTACGTGMVCSAGACATSCPGSQIACTGRCVDPQTDRAYCGASGDCAGTHVGTSCGAGEVCASGACATSCPTGQVNCGGVCVEPDTDRTYCGASGDCAGANAGTTCVSGEVCAAGTCATSCPLGQMDCGGRCVDPATDRGYCGASGDCAGANAGSACASGEVCGAGTCATSCPGTQIVCAGSCADPASDRTYCGASGDCTGTNAGTACASGEVCASGVCTTSCPAGQIVCGGLCVDPATNRFYCGASADCAGANAGVACASGEVCGGGTCATSCPAGQIVCGGLCVDPTTNRGFCGASGDCAGTNAGVVCATGQVCASSTCTTSCPAGEIVCGGSCVDPNVNRTFCGASGDCSGANSGTACGAGQICGGGTCATSCPTGQIVCGGICVDPSANRTHCGASGDCMGGNAGTSCGAGQVCVSSACTASCAAPLMACGGACVDTSNNPMFCGDCATACTPPANSTAYCAGGACGSVCRAGFTDCNGNPADGCECGGGASCTAGVCTAPFPTTSVDLTTVRTQGTCADGGDMVHYSVVGLAGSTASLGSTPSTGCVVAGDRVLLLNLQGTPTATGNVGNWEVLRVASVSGAALTFTSPITRFYGDGSDQSNIGTAAGNQRVMVQRIPTYGDITLAAGATYTASGWDGTLGGLFALNASSVSGTGTISMTGRGYRGGATNNSPFATGQQGESIVGTGVNVPGANGGAGGGGQGDPCPSYGVGGGGGGYGRDGTAAEFGTGCGGYGGTAYGDAALSQIFLGSGGGSGGADNVLSDNPPGGAGGDGGGIVMIFGASTTAGTIVADGAAGVGDAPGVECSSASTSTCYDFSGAGGGGAGGSIRIEGAASAVMARVSAAGGMGGNAFDGAARDGGHGGVGRVVPALAPALPVTAGLLAYYTTRDASSVVASGGSVMQWSDVSGNGFHLWPRGATPIVSATGIGTLTSGIDFNGAGLRVTGMPLVASASITVFAVVHPQASDQWGAIVHHGNRDIDWSMEQSGLQGLDVVHFQSVNDNSGDDLTLDSTQSYVLAGRIDGTTRDFSSTSGGSTVSVTTSGNSITPQNLNFYVGVSDNNEHSNAIIGEIVYYERALSDAERDAVIAYLAGAWGI